MEPLDLARSSPGAWSVGYGPETLKLISEVTRDRGCWGRQLAGQNSRVLAQPPSGPLTRLNPHRTTYRGPSQSTDHRYGPKADARETKNAPS